MLTFFDLATHTGWCRGSGLGLPEIGSEAMPVGDIGPFLAHAEDFMCEFLAETIDHCADGERLYVGFESPILRGEFTNILTLRKLYSLAALLELVCWRMAREYPPGIVVREVQQGTIKALLGIPRYDEKGKRQRIDKLDVWAGARALGLAPSSNDESDALGGWLELVKHYGPPGAWAFWEPKLAAMKPIPPKAPGKRRAKAVA